MPASLGPNANVDYFIGLALGFAVLIVVAWFLE